MLNTTSYDRENYSNISLPKGLELIQDISDKDFEYIQGIIKSTDLSSYLLDSKDFFAIKNLEGNVVSFGRLYPIEKDCKELSSVRVDPNYRGQKIGLYLCKKLIKYKKQNYKLFLATKKSLGNYYKEIGFQTIVDNIPEKLVYTGKRAKEHGINFIIMKYK